MKLIRKYNIGFWTSYSPISKYIIKKVGVSPIIEHYYEPYYTSEQLTKPYDVNRALPMINFRDLEQFELLKQFNFQAELLEIDK